MDNKLEKILIVDNNQTIVEMIADRLTEAGLTPVKTYDGMEALDYLKKEKPDLIVLDLIMPKIDGFRLSKYLKSHAEYRDIPIVIMSGIAMEEETHVYDVDADAFIAKGKIEETFVHLLTTIKWLEAKKEPKKKIMGMESLHPREMTKELLLVKQHFDSMLQLMGEGVIEMDEQHRIFFANKAVCHLLEKSEIELFGKPVQEIFSHAAGLDELLKGLPSNRHFSESGIQLPFDDKIIRFIATPFFFNNMYIGSIAVLEDVTSQVKKEMALEELTSAIIQNAPIGVGLIDNDYRIILANNHLKLLANARGKVRNKAIDNLPAFKSSTFTNLLKKGFSTGQGAPVTEEISLTSSPGKKLKTYHITASPLFHQNGLPYLLVLIEDVTEKADLERGLIATNQELEIANQAKSNFLSIVSHELRTPLSVIRGYISLILEGKISGASGEAVEALKTSDRRARHLQQLIEELLDLSRIEAGKITLKEEIVALRKHIMEVVEMFRHDLERKNLQLKVDLPHTLPNIVADHDKIHQVFTNLISNAIKFTPDGGRILISGSADDGNVRISVKDTGEGIPKDKLQSIFNKFYQVDSSDSRPHEGTGLGLAIVRMILDATGGKISVKSAPGKGSTFTVSLPTGAVEKIGQTTDHSPDETAHPTHGGKKKKTILLCEDDEDTVKIIGYMLPSPDYDLLICRNSFEAIEKTYKNSIDLIMVDIRLPYMNGYDFCRTIKASEKTRNIPIIILSAAGQEEEIKRGYEVGADEYIIKPFSPKDLLEKINKYF